MVVWTVDVKRDPCHPKDDEEEVLEPEILYLSAISILFYLNYIIRLDTSFLII